MSVQYISGDLFHFDGLDGLAHGCNCAGSMGKGIAVPFKRRYPAMYRAYRQRCLEGTFTLGDVFEWPTACETIFNLGTQAHWRSKAELWAVEQALEQMVRGAERRGVKRIGLPRIGAGLGGLSWLSVKEVMTAVGEQASVDLVVFETYVSGELA
ncbi:MAG: macro domain-containing protein [Bradymonadia bacterium]